MLSIEVTTTACNRIDVTDQAYRTWVKLLHDVDWKNSTLYVNVDPCPDPVDQNMFLRMAQSYFGNVVANFPSVANFAAAVKWVWSQVRNEFFLHLEDDWVLLDDVWYSQWILPLINDSSLCQIRLVSNNKRKLLGTYAPDLAPSINRSKCMKYISSIMSTDINPEVQLHQINKHDYNKCMKLYRPVPKKISIYDIGRSWRRRLNIKKPAGEKKEFLTWIKNPPML